MEKTSFGAKTTLFPFLEPKFAKCAKSAKWATCEHLGSLLPPPPPARPGQLWETSGRRSPDASQTSPRRLPVQSQPRPQRLASSGRGSARRESLSLGIPAGRLGMKCTARPSQKVVAFPYSYTRNVPTSNKIMLR